MHKQFVVRFGSLLIIFAVVTLVVPAAGASSGANWLSSTLSLQKEADTQSVPSAIDGNIDCFQEGSSCVVGTAYGEAISGSVRLFGNDFKPVISYIDNRQHFIPVPNSNMAITYTTEPSYGLYFYFNYNFPVSYVDGSSYGFSQKVYKITKAADGRLEDKAHHRLPADYASLSFSENGQWMVVSDPNVTMLRINLQTFEVLPFATGFNYTVGLSPAPKTAITNDGRYAVVASKDFNRFSVYDLDTCATVPNTISGPVSCGSRDLTSFMKQQIPGYSFVAQARFLNDDSLAAYASYTVGGQSKTARFIVSGSTINNQIDYLALGDSYISGEGAFDYQAGTDTLDNHCHLSLISYPYLIGHNLNFDSYHSVACSGTTTNDMINSSGDYRGQIEEKVRRGDRTQQEIDSIFASFKPGYINQSDFVARYRPKVITISVGGNDMGFSDVLLQCIEPGTCYSTYEDRLELVHQINNRVFPRLVQTYQKLMDAGSPDMRIYVVGYPQIALPNGDCAVNVQLNSDELMFAQQLISYLDRVIQAAASRVGAFYVDAQDALYGHKLCEAGPGSVAMNGLTAGNDRPWSFGPIGAETYHPNDLGHQLLENKVLTATHNLTEPLPNADISASAPSESGLDILNAPHSGRAIKAAEYDSEIVDDLIYRQIPANITIDGATHNLGPNSTLQAELHSTPFSLGNHTTDSSGNISSQITVPADVSAGLHTLHLYGVDISGQGIDIYKDVYVATSYGDLDGNDIADSTQACFGVAASGQDYDQDGIDDACDGNVGTKATPPQDQSKDSSQDQVTTVNIFTSSDNINSANPGVINISSIEVSGSTTPTQEQIQTNSPLVAGNEQVSPQVRSASIEKIASSKSIILNKASNSHPSARSNLPEIVLLSACTLTILVVAWKILPG